MRLDVVQRSHGVGWGVLETADKAADLVVRLDAGEAQGFERLAQVLGAHGKSSVASWTCELGPSES